MQQRDTSCHEAVEIRILEMQDISPRGSIHKYYTSHRNRKRTSINGNRPSAGPDLLYKSARVVQLQNNKHRSNPQILEGFESELDIVQKTALYSATTIYRSIHHVFHATGRVRVLIARCTFRKISCFATSLFNPHFQPFMNKCGIDNLLHPSSSYLRFHVRFPPFCCGGGCFFLR